jgi:hypothetical protein|tara:strand:- start:402 stop:899 length:498 start_codon:yes stop_codon:yes gene_type:complete
MFKNINNINNKLESITKLAYSETTEQNETLTFLDLYPKRKLHSWDCDPTIFEYIPYTILNIKSFLLKSKTSEQVYLTLKQVAVIAGVDRSSVNKYFKDSKAMIKKGAGGGVAYENYNKRIHSKTVGHVNQNLIELTSATKYINNHMTRQLKTLGKLNNSQFRKVD